MSDYIIGTCGDCEYFVSREFLKKGDAKAPNFNECRRYPPRRSDSGTRLYAPVYANDWCGEYKPAPLEPIESVKADTVEGELRDIREAVKEVNEGEKKGRKRHG